VFFGVTLPSTLLAPSDRLQRGLRADSVAAKGKLLLMAAQVRQYRDERLWGSGGEDLDTWKGLKVYSIKCIEPGDAVSQHGGDKLGIEDLTACDGVLVKKRDPTVNHIQWYRQQRQARERSQLLDFGECFSIVKGALTRRGLVITA
jgi:hypothetical protein